MKDIENKRDNRENSKDEIVTPPMSLCISNNKDTTDRTIKLSTKIDNSETSKGFDAQKFASRIEIAYKAINSLGLIFAEAAIKSAQVVSAFLEKYDYSIFDKIQNALLFLGKQSKLIEQEYQKALYEAKWFPHAIRTSNFQLFEDITNVLETTRNSQNRIKKLDKVIFSYYDKTALNEIKREWRNNSEIPSYMKRILSQAVNAYHRREYALTNSVLMTLWEGIIDAKLGKQNEYRISGKTRQNITELNARNDIGDFVTKFCNDYIFYNCNSLGEVKDDVPGRHGIAHSWYTKYPSRKTSLNAILFTDFLLTLEPKKDKAE